jgi:hypothetical protein
MTSRQELGAEVTQGGSHQTSPSSTLHAENEHVDALPINNGHKHPTIRDGNGNPIAYSATRPSPNTTRMRGISQTSSLRRHTSNPPAGRLWRQCKLTLVSAFGGVAPEDDEEDEGFMAVRSREEADAREQRLEEKGEDPWRVKFEPGDKENPKVCWSDNDADDDKNWSVARRWYITSAGALLVLNSTFASSAPSGIV